MAGGSGDGGGLYIIFILASMDSGWLRVHISLSYSIPWKVGTITYTS